MAKEGPGAFHPNAKHIYSVYFLSSHLSSEINMWMLADILRTLQLLDAKAAG